MKNKLFMIVFGAVGFATSAKAQTSATDNSTVASATIVSPIIITKTQDMNFGSIIAGATPGTVVLAPGGGVTASGVVMFTGGGAITPFPAMFEISGQEGFSYTITLPADNTVILNDGFGNSMNLTGFIDNSTGNFGAAPEIFQVGATLNVNASQPGGIYASSPFDVTVAYE